VRPNSSTLWLRNPHTDKGHLPFHAPLNKICDRAAAVAPPMYAHRVGFHRCVVREWYNPLGGQQW